MTDHLRYYDLEKYLFDDLSPRFRQGEVMTAFDFFCIVIWKANRAKSRMAKKLLTRMTGAGDLDAAVAELVTDLRQAATASERLQVMLQKWDFRMPMATAILTVFYPDEFTVYDYRACEALNEDFSRIGDMNTGKAYNDLWEQYSAFVKAVRATGPAQLSLRDKDRALWARSFHDQLHRDIQNQFGGVSSPTTH